LTRSYVVPLFSLCGFVVFLTLAKTLHLATRILAVRCRNWAKKAQSPYDVDIFGILARKRSAGETPRQPRCPIRWHGIRLWNGVAYSKTSQSQTLCEISRGKKPSVQPEHAAAICGCRRSTALKASRYQRRLSEGKEPHPFQAPRCHRHIFAARCPEAAVSKYPRRSDGDR
jgi:hypothetical protein